VPARRSSRQRLREERLAGTRGPDQQDVALGELDLVILAAGFKPLVMVINRDGKNFLGEILADDVLVEDLADLVRRGKLVLVRARRLGSGTLLADDVVAK